MTLIKQILSELQWTAPDWLNKTLVKRGDVIESEKWTTTSWRVRDNPDSFYNEVLSSDILYDLKKVNGKVTDKDVRNLRRTSEKHATPSNIVMFLITHSVIEVTW